MTMTSIEEAKRYEIDLKEYNSNKEKYNNITPSSQYKHKWRFFGFYSNKSIYSSSLNEAVKYRDDYETYLKKSDGLYFMGFSQFCKIHYLVEHPHWEDRWKEVCSMRNEFKKRYVENKNALQNKEKSTSDIFNEVHQLYVNKGINAYQTLIKRLRADGTI